MRNVFRRVDHGGYGLRGYAVMTSGVIVCGYLKRIPIEALAPGFIAASVIYAGVIVVMVMAARA